MHKPIPNLTDAKIWHGILLLNSRDDTLQDAFVFEESMRLLSLEQQSRILRKKSYPDKCRALCNQLLQMSGISMVTGLDYTRLKFQKGTYGKPHIANIDRLVFSMSNGERYVAQYILKGECYDVGIDLASTADYCGDEDLKHFKEIFSTQEFESLIQCDPIKRSFLFAHIWSLKECYTKFTGLGLNSDLGNIDFGKVELFDRETSFKRRIHQKEIWFYSNWVTSDEVVTVCHESNFDLDRNPCVYDLSLQDALDQLQKTHSSIQKLVDQ